LVLIKLENFQLAQLELALHSIC